MPPTPINEPELEWTEHDGVTEAFRQKQLGEGAGSEKLGCSLYELPAGCQPWSHHYHTANEEALYVLSGTGTLHLDGDTQAIRAGDYVPCPADESGGHSVVNDSDAPLRYLAFSTMNEPDITVHPEIDKLGVYVGAPPGSRDERSLTGFYDTTDTVDDEDDVADADTADDGGDRGDRDDGTDGNDSNDGNDE